MRGTGVLVFLRGEKDGGEAGAFENSVGAAEEVP